MIYKGALGRLISAISLFHAASPCTSKPISGDLWGYSGRLNMEKPALWAETHKILPIICIKKKEEEERGGGII